MLFNRIDRDVVAFLNADRCRLKMNGIKWKTLKLCQASLGSEPIFEFIYVSDVPVSSRVRMKMNSMEALVDSEPLTYSVKTSLPGGVCSDSLFATHFDDVNDM
jgi:hypothetical protein